MENLGTLGTLCLFRPCGGLWELELHSHAVRLAERWRAITGVRGSFQALGFRLREFRGKGGLGSAGLGDFANLVYSSDCAFGHEMR